jgi:hypothetical protein
MKRSQLFFMVLIAAGIISILSGGCKEESNPASPPEPVEHPPATMVTLIVKDSAGVAFVDSCTVRDTSLSHVKVELVGSLDLQSGKTYRCMFKLYDDSSPDTTIDLTSDIVSEKDAHLFRFQYNATDTSRLHVTNIDSDNNGLQFGLNFILVVSAGGPASGNLHVILEHHDDGNKLGSEFDLDLDRDFPVNITP